MVLAELHAGRRSLGGSSVSACGEGLGERLGAVGGGSGRVDVSGQRLGQRLRPVVGERHDGVFAAMLAQIAQRGGGQVVVGVRECRPAFVGDRVHARRATAATLHDATRLALDEQAIAHEGVKVPADRSRRQAQLLGQCCRTLWAAFEHKPGDGVASAVRSAAARAASGVVPYFHYTSMTYFRSVAQPPRTTGNGSFTCVLYRTLELTLAPALRVAYRPEITGFERVPPTGAVIVAANHISFADEIFTPLAARRQVLYFAKAEYFTAPGVRGRAMAAFFRGCGHVPVERADTRSAASVIEIGVDLLRDGNALGIYPEGTRSPDGRLHKFRTGVARLAMRSGAPVVPVGLVGTREVQPPGSRRWHRTPVAVHFGQPMYFGDRAAEERSSRALREVTETVREAVQALSGQDYVNAFAASGTRA
jgi:1-acyl-sn-glycerol-3-phosphate acyltransferase